MDVKRLLETTWAVEIMYCSLQHHAEHLGEASGELGVQKAHEVMSRAYAVSFLHERPLLTSLTALFCQA